MISEVTHDLQTGQYTMVFRGLTSDVVSGSQLVDTALQAAVETISVISCSGPSGVIVLTKSLVEFDLQAVE